MNLPGNIEGDTFVVDTETTGLDVMRDSPLYLAWRAHGRYGCEPWSEMVADWLNDHLPTAGRIITHNAKFDLHMFIQGGVRPEVVDYAPVFCTMVGAQLCDEHRHSYALDALTMDLFAKGKTTTLFEALAEKFGGATDSSQLRHLRHAPQSLVAEYANQDTELCRQMFLYEGAEVAKQELDNIVDLEMRALKVLLRMERRGVPVFRDRAENAVYAMRDAIDRADDDLWQTVGYRTNPRSQKALEYAFRLLGLPAMESFDKEHLALVNHSVAEKILDYRQVLMAQDAFATRLQDWIGPDGRIHCNFNQNRHEEGGTRTGRLSATDPNLQQIPMRIAAIARVIRAMFGAKGLKWNSGDWSQFEYRIFAHFVADPRVIAAYWSNPDTDFHQALADITGVPREKSKRINLGLVFGMGDGKLAHMLGLPCREYEQNGRRRWEPGQEAQTLFAQYHSRAPRTRPYLRQSAAEAESRGFITSIYGRRLRFPDREKAYKAGGLRFQASAADIMKEKLIELDEALMSGGTGAELILPVHDEFNVLCPEGAEAETCATMKRVMEHVPALTVPVLAEVAHGDDWWEASV